MLTFHKINGHDYIYAHINIDGRAKWFYVGAGKKLRLEQLNTLTHKINSYVHHRATRRKHKIDLRSFEAVNNYLIIESMNKDLLVLSST